MKVPLVADGGLEKVCPLRELVVFRGETWDLSHLRGFGFTHSLTGAYVHVVFSCHCFTRDATYAELADRKRVPDEHWYKDERELRVLDEGRYLLSRKFLPKLIQELEQRDIRLADEHRRNFVTIEVLDEQGLRLGYYSIFFEVTKSRVAACCCASNPPISGPMSRFASGKASV